MAVLSHLRTALALLAAIGLLAQSTVAQEVATADQLPSGAVGRFGTLEYRTAGWCETAALSPDGKLLAVAGAKSIALTDLASGKAILEFAEDDAIRLSFLEQGKTLVSVNSQGVVRYWSLQSGSEIRESWQAFLPEHNENSYYVVLSPGGNLLLALDEENVNIWDLDKHKRLHQFKTPADSGPYALAPDGNSVAAFGEHSILMILDSATGKPKVTTDKFDGYRVGIRYSPTGKWVATCGGYFDYRVWDTGTLNRQLSADRPHRESNQMVFSPDDKLLMTTQDDGFLRLWDLPSKKEIWKASLTAEGYWMQMQSVIFTPDQKRIISVEHPVIRIWDVATGRELTASSRPQHVPRRLAASTDGKTLASAHAQTLHVWDVATFKERFLFDGVESRVDATFSRASDKLVYAHIDRSARVIDAHSGKELARLDGHIGGVAAVTFAAGDKEVLTASYDGKLRAWDVGTGKELRKHDLAIPAWFGSHPYDDSRYHTFSPDGQTLTSCYFLKDNYQLWRYSTKSGERISEGDASRPFSVVFLAPDGRTFVGRGRGVTLDVFDAVTGEATLSLHAASKKLPQVLWFGDRVAAYSPDSRFLAVPDEKGEKIDLWDIGARKKVHSIPHSWSIDFTFVGNNFLATPASDATILLWDVSKLRVNPK